MEAREIRRHERHGRLRIHDASRALSERAGVVVARSDGHVQEVLVPHLLLGEVAAVHRLQDAVMGELVARGISARDARTGEVVPEGPWIMRLREKALDTRDKRRVERRQEVARPVGLQVERDLTVVGVVDALVTEHVVADHVVDVVAECLKVGRCLAQVVDAEHTGKVQRRDRGVGDVHRRDEPVGADIVHPLGRFHRCAERVG